MDINAMFRNGLLESPVNSSDEEPNGRPCADYNCGEAGCVAEGNKPICKCPKTLQPPDENLKCVHPIGSPLNEDPIRQPCKDYNCGEAGCVAEGDKPVCLCTDTLQPPDEQLKCDHGIGSPLDVNSKVNLPAVDAMPGLPFEQPGFIAEQANTTASEPDPMVVKSHDDIHSDISADSLYIVIPVIGALVLIIVVIIAVALRKRRSIYSRTPKLDSPVAFLHKQDSVSLLENLTVVSKNPVYCTHELEDALLAELRDKHVPRDKIHLLEEIGEGAFGKVFKGEMQISEDCSTPVAIKILKSDASRENRDDFRREVKIMSSFDHPNILKLNGIVPVGEDSPYMIFEYMEYGDLTEVLRRNDPCLGAKHPIRLRQTDLIDIATQIANGMVYLASRHFVHRDLATRNCLVGAGLVVKISDFGMSRDIYTCDYYKIGGARMLPVRWMSPESMKYGKFTTESDVWALGVVLWEIFSFGKQPHYGHANEEVIRFIEDGILLQRPNTCPETLYHIMLGCWRRDPRERFKFERIHNLLVEYERKVIKYARHISLQRVSETEEV